MNGKRKDLVWEDINQPNVDGTKKNLAPGLWEDIMTTYLMPDYLPVFDDYGMWKNAAAVLYYALKDSLIEAVKSLEPLPECEEISNLANDAYEKLDIICFGGVVFKPGHCQVCASLVS